MMALRKTSAFARRELEDRADQPCKSADEKREQRQRQEAVIMPARAAAGIARHSSLLAHDLQRGRSSPWPRSSFDAAIAS
jgi:hypothetical protein